MGEPWVQVFDRHIDDNEPSVVEGQPTGWDGSMIIYATVSNCWAALPTTIDRSEELNHHKKQSLAI